jgi:tetratricopeptide (TPR) repeat protein
MPNLLQAVNETLDAGEDFGAEFVDSVCRFLDIFGRIADASALIEKSRQVSGPVGSRSWNFAQFRRGEHLLNLGRVDEARACFEAIALFDGTPKYELATALSGVARCLASAGHSVQAEEKMRRTIEISLQLNLDDEVAKRNLSSQLTDLADVLADQRRFDEAEDMYCRSFRIDVELGDVRGQGVVAAQLGALALRRGLLDEAERRYEESLSLARTLGEPSLVAATLHQLGNIFIHRRKLDSAERYFREASSISESIGDQASAAQSWAALATVLELVGKPAAAQAWYRKSIDTQGDNPRLQAVQLTNLADLLSDQPERLAESRELALKALAMKQSLDPGASQIWETYDVLARIADRQSLPEEAAEYRHQSRESRRLFPGTSQEVQRFFLAQDMVIRAVHGEEEALEQAEAIVLMMKQSGGDFPEFANSLQGILTGERDRTLLTEKLPGRLSAIVDSILLALGGVNPEK